MPRILHINASPRPESVSLRLAKAFIESFKSKHPNMGVETMDLFTMNLPEFDAPTVAAKYAILSGQQPAGHVGEVWKTVIDHVNHFKSADMYVISSPMWNFGIPYLLKQYLDIIIQPGLSFTCSPAKGHKDIITGKPAILMLARGGNYPTVEGQTRDHQKSYLETILQLIGFTDIRSVIAEGTLMAPAVAEPMIQQAIKEAQKLAENIYEFA